VQYLVNISKYKDKQWVVAHNAVMTALTPMQRKSLPNKQIKELAGEWLATPKRL
jgi:hypothetical protein